MLHDMLYRILQLQWILFPIPVYLIIRKQYLDNNQKKLLMVLCVWFLLYLIGGWIMQVMRLIIYGILSLIILEISIGQFTQTCNQQIKTTAQKQSSPKNINKTLLFAVSQQKNMRKLKLEQTFLVPLVVFFWIILKVYFTRAYEFIGPIQLPDQNIFEGFLTTYHGWNCNYLEYTTIPIIWFVIVLFSNKIIILCQQYQVIYLTSKAKAEDLYSYYLQNYLIWPIIFTLFTEIAFNLSANIMSSGIIECYPFWKYGILFQFIIHCCAPITILLFFYKKNGKFELQSSSRSESRISTESVVGEELNIPLNRDSFELKVIQMH